MRANYATYVSKGPTLLVDGHGDEVEMEMETEAATSNADGNMVYGGRFGFLPIPAIELGLSGAVGKIGVAEGHEVSELSAGEPDRDYTVIGVDAIYNWSTLQLRGEFIEQSVGSDSGSTIADGAAAGDLDFTKKDGRFTKTDEVLASHIMNGFKSPGSSMAMPAKVGISSLTQEQAEAIVTHMRQAFAGN